jgi:hypothetical protein
MELTWGSYGFQQGPGGLVHKDRVLPSCTLSSGCLASPRMQTVSSLPSGTSAPNTVITGYVVSKYQLQTPPERAAADRCRRRLAAGRARAAADRQAAN